MDRIIKRFLKWVLRGFIGVMYFFSVVDVELEGE